MDDFLENISDSYFKNGNCSIFTDKHALNSMKNVWKIKTKKSKRTKRTKKVKKKKKEFVAGVYLKATATMPQKIMIPANLKKDELFDFLKKKEIFDSSQQEVVRSTQIMNYKNPKSMKLSLYWRSVYNNYKSAVFPCMIHRLSEGTRLTKNILANIWGENSDRWTYGNILILNIQDGDKDFKYSSYTTEEFKNQVVFNSIIKVKKLFTFMNRTQTNEYRLFNVNSYSKDNIVV